MYSNICYKYTKMEICTMPLLISLYNITQRGLIIAIEIMRIKSVHSFCDIL